MRRFAWRLKTIGFFVITSPWRAAVAGGHKRRGQGGRGEYRNKEKDKDAKVPFSGHGEILHDVERLYHISVRIINFFALFRLGA